MKYSKEELEKIADKLRKDEERKLLPLLKDDNRLLWEAVSRIEALEDRVSGMEVEIREPSGGELATEYEFKVLPQKEAIKIIEKYVNKNPGCTTSQIIEELQLDPSLVVEVLDKLEKEKKLEGKEIKHE